jgi:hypothetical protein
MADVTNTDAQHPALATVTGEAAPIAPPATGTDDQHPAIVTRPGDPKPAPSG